jgi:hypothetical protein
MRKLKAFIQIQAPVQTVKSLTDLPHRQAWMVTRSSNLVRTVSQSWEAAEVNGGTRFTLQMAYASRIPFLEPFVMDGVQSAITHSLSRLKQIAEASQPQGQ